MSYSEEDLLPISALQHLLFCERQCALIHVERLWAENQLTVEGRFQHRKAHEGPDTTRDGVRAVRGLWLRSFELGIVGIVDLVEFRAPPGTEGTARALRNWIAATQRSPVVNERRSFIPTGSASRGQSPPDLAAWEITPVEYKRGRPKLDDCDRVQLCAQAICLEEMLGISIDRGYLFYGQPRRRTEAVFDGAMRKKTIDAAARLHEILDAGITPSARREPKCKSCSLLDLCLPAAAGGGRVASRFVELQLSHLLSSDGPTTDFFEAE